MDQLMAYAWPGNARELKSAFEFAFVSCPDGMIDADHLPPQNQLGPVILLRHAAPTKRKPGRCQAAAADRCPEAFERQPIRNRPTAGYFPDQRVEPNKRRYNLQRELKQLK
jgi:DNA-binding NtrC family response regulator